MADTPKTIIDRISADVKLLSDMLSTPTSLPAVSAPEAFDAALAGAADTIVLDTSFVYSKPLTLSRSVHLRTAMPHTGRVSRDEQLPTFQKGIVISAPHVHLTEVAVTHDDPTQPIIAVRAFGTTLTRVRVLGDPARGSKRGVEGNGEALSMEGCYVADCFGPYPGGDCQAFCAWDTPGPITITDCYLEGSTETLMIGGADPRDDAHVPSDIVIRACTITKNPAWQSRAVGVKNTLELKNARRVLITNCDVQYSWGGKGQDGYLLMLTPRNQNGTAPYSGVQDVVVTGNRFAHGAGGLAILGSDNNHPSLRTAGVKIVGNTFDDLDPIKFAGSNKMILIVAGPQNVTIDQNQFAGSNIGSQVYFDGSPQAEGLVVTNNTWPKSKYGVFGTGASVGKAWDKYVASGTLSGNLEQ